MRSTHHYFRALFVMVSIFFAMPKGYCDGAHSNPTFTLLDVTPAFTGKTQMTAQADTNGVANDLRTSVYFTLSGQKLDVRQIFNSTEMLIGAVHATYCGIDYIPSAIPRICVLDSSEGLPMTHEISAPKVGWLLVHYQESGRQVEDAINVFCDRNTSGNIHWYNNSPSCSNYFEPGN